MTRRRGHLDLPHLTCSCRPFAAACLRAQAIKWRQHGQLVASILLSTVQAVSRALHHSARPPSSRNHTFWRVWSDSLVMADEVTRPYLLRPPSAALHRARPSQKWLLRQVRRLPDEGTCLELLSGGESLRVHVDSQHNRDELCRAFSIVLGCDVPNYGLLADLIDLSSETVAIRRGEHQPAVSRLSSFVRS